MLRRNFIKKTGIVTGGLLMQQELLHAFAANTPLKVAVIGCGDRGNGLIQVMQELKEQFKVTAICDTLDFRLAATQKLLGGEKIASYKDYKKLLAEADVQAVLVATSLNAHYDIALAALKAGKHVYLEKAMTYNISQALDLVKAKALHPNLTLQVGHQYRYTPLYFKVKEMIDKGYLGKVTQIDCRWDRNWNWRRPVPEPSLERKINWRMYKEYSGGLAAELLSHQIDFINWAFDTHPTEVYATGGVDYYKDGRETFDNVQATFRYDKDGMIGNYGATCANARDGYLFKLKGTKGSVSLLMNQGVFYPEKETKAELETVDGVTGATKIVWNKDGGIPIEADKSKDGTWYALKDFFDCIVTKKNPPSNVLTGATTAICVHLANEAMYNRKIQYWQKEYDVFA